MNEKEKCGEYYTIATNLDDDIRGIHFTTKNIIDTPKYTGFKVLSGFSTWD